MRRLVENALDDTSAIPYLWAWFAALITRLPLKAVN